LSQAFLFKAILEVFAEIVSDVVFLADWLY